jgi:multifunctional methyltransferase subunit TRM112
MSPCLLVYVGADFSKLGFSNLPERKPEGEALNDEQTLKDLHRLLLETHVIEGKLVCGNCGHEYMIKEGIANFLLPSHLGLRFPDIIYVSPC